MGAQIADGQLAAEAVQRMIGMRDRNRAQPHQGVAKKTRRHLRRDRKIRPPGKDGFGRAAHHRFDDLDARVRALGPEALETLQQEP